MGRISKEFLILLMVVSMMHLLVMAQVPSPPPPSRSRKLYCDAQCLFQCIQGWVVKPWRMAFCIGGCLTACLHPPYAIFDCTRNCARAAIANIHLVDAESGEQMEQVRAAINSCYGSCAGINQKPSN